MVSCGVCPPCNRVALLILVRTFAERTSLALHRSCSNLASCAPTMMLLIEPLSSAWRHESFLILGPTPGKLPSRLCQNAPLDVVGYCSVHSIPYFFSEMKPYPAATRKQDSYCTKNRELMEGRTLSSKGPLAEGSTLKCMYLHAFCLLHN